MVSTNFKIIINCFFFSYFGFSWIESNQVRESRVLVTTDFGSTTSAITSRFKKLTRTQLTVVVQLPVDMDDAVNTVLRMERKPHSQWG